MSNISIADLGLEPTPDLRCSVLAADLGDSVLGSAGYSSRFVLVDLPLPWPSEISDHRLLADLGPTGDTQILAVTGTVLPGAERDTTPTHQIIVYEGRGGNRFRQFDGFETTVRTEELLATLRQLIEGDLSVVAPMDPPLGSGEIRDVLICTHGARDRCCGQMGTQIFRDLQEGLFQNRPAGLSRTRLWRTSHTGGHRFAPVALTFPDGYTWGVFDQGDIEAILTRDRHPAELVAFNRGCLGFSEPSAQAADSTVLSEVGWTLLQQPRRVEQIATVDQASTVHHLSPAGTYSITVNALDPIPVPPCGAPLDQAKKTTVPIVLDTVRHLD